MSKIFNKVTLVQISIESSRFQGEHLPKQEPLSSSKEFVDHFSLLKISDGWLCMEQRNKWSRWEGGREGEGQGGEATL